MGAGEGEGRTGRVGAWRIAFIRKCSSVHEEYTSPSFLLPVTEMVEMVGPTGWRRLGTSVNALPSMSPNHFQSILPFYEQSRHSETIYISM